MTDPRPTDLGQPKGGRFRQDGGRVVVAAIPGSGKVKLIIRPDDGGSLGTEMSPDNAEGVGKLLIEMAKIARGGGG